MPGVPVAGGKRCRVTELDDQELRRADDRLVPGVSEPPDEMLASVDAPSFRGDLLGARCCDCVDLAHAAHAAYATRCIALHALHGGRRHRR
jgi:hypothetical protein